MMAIIQWQKLNLMFNTGVRLKIRVGEKDQ